MSRVRYGSAARFPHRAIPGNHDIGAEIGARDQRAKRVDAANALGRESSRRGLRLLLGKAVTTVKEARQAGEREEAEGLFRAPPVDALALARARKNWSHARTAVGLGHWPKRSPAIRIASHAAAFEPSVIGCEKAFIRPLGLLLPRTYARRQQRLSCGMVLSQ
jgi:hypothetical protein